MSEIGAVTVEQVPIQSNDEYHFYPNFMKRAVQFLVSISLFSFLFSYFSGLTFVWSDNLQFSTLYLSFFVQAMDRKYMFLICNGILAFLAKNLNKGVDYGGFVKSSSMEDGLKQTISDNELPQILVEEATSVRENVASSSSPRDVAVAEENHVAHDREKQEQEYCEDSHETARDGMKTTEAFVLESQDTFGEEEEEEDDEEEEDQLKESRVEEVTDAIVSTEELNKKFEEFIRKMKEEIRIEAQQPLITV